MNDEERIIRYFDNDLSDIERSTFEADLKTNTEFKKLFDEFLGLNNLLGESKKVEYSDPNYFINIVPRFRQRKIKVSRYFSIPNLGFALTIILLLVMSYILVSTDLIFNGGNQITISEISEELADSDIDEILRYMDGENESYNLDQLTINYFENDLNELDELINQIPETEFNSLADAASNDISFDISAEEADKIFEELINKNFRNEVKL
ncbi:MAG TPA: hypothetical protein VI362_05540 [Ignavibacteriaceae bacterium]|nr:hypothetical protein [Ignavibacteriaceae bacterium]